MPERPIPDKGGDASPNSPSESPEWQPASEEEVASALEHYTEALFRIDPTLGPDGARDLAVLEFDQPREIGKFVFFDRFDAQMRIQYPEWPNWWELPNMDEWWAAQGPTPR